MPTYDVTVIGAGPGGYVAAIRAAQRGAAVALVEREALGGTCLNWGCIPTKTLIAAADVLETVRRAGDFGIKVTGEVTPDWQQMMQNKDRVVSGLRSGIAALVKGNRIDLYEGSASFADRHRIRISGATGNDTVIETKSTIIATGSESVAPGFVPQAPNVLYSREALAAEALPKSLLVLGGGVIGCEFACLYARLGVSVTLVELLPDILPFQEPDAVRVVRSEMKKLGIRVLTNSRMTEIEPDGRRVKAQVGDEKLEAQQLLVCIGRKPVTRGLNLAGIGITPDERGMISVDSRCRTRVPGVYAIGDVCSTIQLAHWASAQGICAANNATGGKDELSTHCVPSCIFTSPEIGAVGMTEAQAAELGTEIRIGKFMFAGLGKARALQETAGFCKIIADATTDQVLGVHIVGPHATDLIAEAATAMSLEVTAEELGRAIHAHPTLAEATMEAAHAVHDACIHAPPVRRKSRG